MQYGRGPGDSSNRPCLLCGIIAGGFRPTSHQIKTGPSMLWKGPSAGQGRTTALSSTMRPVPFRALNVRPVTFAHQNTCPPS
jgi:hypothetical protein